MTAASGRPSAAVTLSAATVVATVVGGALGVTVVHPDWLPTAPILLGGLGLIALAGIVLVHVELAHRPAAVVRGRSGDDDEQQTARSTAADPGGEPPTAERAAEHPAANSPGPDPPARAPDSEQVQLALPVPSGQWWGREGPSTRGPGAAPAAGHAPPPELETYLQSSVIAQCPRCGSFQLDAEAVPPGYGFECRACGAGWDWQPDQPWPAVRINPRPDRTEARTDAPGVAGT